MLRAWRKLTPSFALSLVSGCDYPQSTTSASTSAQLPVIWNSGWKDFQCFLQQLQRNRVCGGNLPTADASVMGNVMQNWVGHYYEAYIKETKAAPDYMFPPTFDPNFGFDTPRKERVMVATMEEMDAMNLAMHERDYCAHKLIKLKSCMRSNFPVWWRCKHAKHDWHHCEYDDMVMRSKEYERERRLKLRALRAQGLDGNGKPLDVART